MLAVERRAIILEEIKRCHIVKIVELRALLDVTDETIRKDLDILENGEEIIRTHGGAMLNQSKLDLTAPVIERKNINTEPKNRIGMAAAKMIAQGEAVFLDGSTSSQYLAKHISDEKNITVITNSQQVIGELASAENINVMCVGGTLRKKNMSYIGPTAMEMIRKQFYASKMFFSCYGVSMSLGLTDSEESETEVKRTMMERADTLILLCDSSKFNKIGFPHLMDFSKVDMIITDCSLSEDWKIYLTQQNVEIICV